MHTDTGHLLTNSHRHRQSCFSANVSRHFRPALDIRVGLQCFTIWIALNRHNTSPRLRETEKENILSVPTQPIENITQPNPMANPTRVKLRINN